MPKVYSYKSFTFILAGDDGCGTYFYDIIHSSGRHWDYRHPFTSINEIQTYVDNM